MNPKQLYNMKVKIPRKGNFIYFEDLFPGVMDLDFDDVAFIRNKGFEVAMGLIDWETRHKSVSCSHCDSILCFDMNEIEQYAICPHCGAVLVDID